MSEAKQKPDPLPVETACSSHDGDEHAVLPPAVQDGGTEGLATRIVGVLVEEGCIHEWDADDAEKWVFEELQRNTARSEGSRSPKPPA